MAASVVAVEADGTADVYDLTVEGQHEFYASGVLVHNCLRYLCMAGIQWMDQGPNVPRGVAPLPMAGKPQQPPMVRKSPEQLERERLLQRSADMVKNRKKRRGGATRFRRG